MFRSTSLTFFFAFGIAVFFLGVLPLWDGISSMRAKVSDDEVLIAELQNLQQRKDQLVKIYNSVSDENIKKLEAVVPATSGSTDASFLYLFVESVARESGLRVDTLSVTTPDDKTTQQAVRGPSVPVSGAGATQPVPTGAAITPKAPTKFTLQTNTVTVAARGTYDSFKVFLNTIEGNLRIMDITNVGIESDAQGFVYTVTLKTYHQ